MGQSKCNWSNIDSSVCKLQGTTLPVARRTGASLYGICTYDTST